MTPERDWNLVWTFEVAGEGIQVWDLRFGSCFGLHSINIPVRPGVFQLWLPEAGMQRASRENSGVEGFRITGRGLDPSMADVLELHFINDQAHVGLGDAESLDTRWKELNERDPAILGRHAHRYRELRDSALRRAGFALNEFIRTPGGIRDSELIGESPELIARAQAVLDSDPTVPAGVLAPRRHYSASLLRESLQNHYLARIKDELGEIAAGIRLQRPDRAQDGVYRWQNDIFGWDTRYSGEEAVFGPC